MAEGSTGSEDKAKKAGGGSARGAGGGMLGTLLSVVNLLISGGMVGVLYLSLKKEQSRATVDDINVHSDNAAEHGAEGGDHDSVKKAAQKAAIDFGKMVTLEQFTVNLATSGSVNPKFARVNIAFEVPTDIAENEVNAKMPQVRNTIIDLFNSKRPSDLATVDGREYLKDEIKNAVNNFMVSGKVKGVYFTSFAISG